MDKSCMAGKLWGGRFSESTDLELNKLNASLDIDKRMYAEDIQASIVYAKALCKAKLLTEDEARRIKDGLIKVKKEWDSEKFIEVPSDEDIHTANERRLTEIIGNTARKLHTGRSRNDQVATDTRLWLRKGIDNISKLMKDVIQVLLTQAEKDIDVLMPGYTHLQRAQPIRWSHWILSHTWAMKSDLERLLEIRKRVNSMPLGCGALAGNPFPIDRTEMAIELGFESIVRNSMVAVGDRDFIAEFLFWASLTSIHLSKLSEDLIIYSSQEFDFVKLSDAFSTGSSLMPQKRNPDSLELIRGKSGTLYGKCAGFMMTLKGLPSTYNKDLQEDKEALFSAYDTLVNVLNVTQGMLETLTINPEKCRAALTYDMLATDIAYYLVRKGVTFREAHHIVGQVVTLSKDTAIRDIGLSQLQSISKAFEEDIEQVWDFERSVEQYQAAGGTSLTAVQHQIALLRSWLCKETRK
ncbi:argininosuccinate lyase [Orussus abietinus]|uniref:argininosuccinate lyase n=1 Tax=Orussus abietinus TaxID=222816 RepID=UPI000626317B|nr:argininosuccinate lyase [Orussus abietinus]